MSRAGRNWRSESTQVSESRPWGAPGLEGKPMLRMESETGWWLIRHPDHARLAGAFAAAWGNELFRRPEPRDRVLHGIATHDDGWAARDAHPTITRQGKPS